MEKEMVIVLDYGGQYNQLIARRVRECNVYCEVKPYNSPIEEIKKLSPKGIIITGGPNSVYAEDALLCDKELFTMGVPILGICYGSQLMAHMCGGKVATAPVSEYGHTEVTIDAADSELFAEVPASTSCWMSHTDFISQVPEGFRVTATTDTCPTAAMECAEKNFYGVQFHPEFTSTPRDGHPLFEAFVRAAIKQHNEKQA